MKETLARPAQILLALRDAEDQRTCSIARLRKICDCRMSDLMRDLAQLAQGGWVVLEHDADGNATAALSEQGRLLCDALAASAVPT